MADENDNVMDEATDKKASIKLVQATRTMPNETWPMYVVKSMVDYLGYEVGQRLTKAQVQALVDNGGIKVTIS